MATIRRPDRESEYWVDFRYRGRRVRRRSPVQSKQAADEFERILRNDFVHRDRVGADPFAEVPMFGDFAERWYSGYVLANCRGATHIWARGALDRELLPAFRHVRLSEITPERVDAFKAKLASRGLAASTINSNLTVLRACMSRAVDWGKLVAVPRIKRMKTPPPSDDFLLPEESDRLLGALNDPFWRAFVHLLLDTGLRFSEAAALRWEDVRLDGPCPQLVVKRTYSANRLVAPKNNKFRDLPLTEGLVAALREHPRTDERVFPRDVSATAMNSLANDRLRKACVQAGVRHTPCHRLRHTFASQLVMQGVPLRTVQMLLGHSTIKMTERYAHLAPNALDNAAAAVRLLPRHPSGHQPAAPNAAA